MKTRAQAPAHERDSVGDDRLLDVHEAAALLGLRPSTLYQWAYQRRIPVVKIGRALRFRLSALLRLIEVSERPALSSSA
jgi:excisionase family DNA binding protein